MANHTGRGQWQPGQSGNPKGRPPKERALTAILERAGNVTIDDGDKRTTRKRILARLAWEVATTAKATLPDGTVLQFTADEWFDAMKFLYSHIDGPPKQEMDVTSNGNSILVEYVNDWRETTE